MPGDNFTMQKICQINKMCSNFLLLLTYIFRFSHTPCEWSYSNLKNPNWIFWKIASPKRTLFNKPFEKINRTTRFYVLVPGHFLEGMKNLCWCDYKVDNLKATLSVIYMGLWVIYCDTNKINLSSICVWILVFSLCQQDDPWPGFTAFAAPSRISPGPVHRGQGVLPARSALRPSDPGPGKTRKTLLSQVCLG